MIVQSLIKLKTETDIEEYKVNIKIIDNIYTYIENSSKKTKVEFDNNKNILKRENSELVMEYHFIESTKTIGKIYIKELKQFLEVIINTSKIEKTKNKIIIKYYLEEKPYEYIIDWSN